jgi:hypothetical protein
MSGSVGLNTSGVPGGSAMITPVSRRWSGGTWVAPSSFDTQGREQATKHHTRIEHSVARPECRMMRARCQPVHDRNTFAVALLTARSPWLAGRSQAQHMPGPTILLGSHPWPPTPRTPVPDRGQPEASVRRAS